MVLKVVNCVDYSFYKNFYLIYLLILKLIFEINQSTIKNPKLRYSSRFIHIIPYKDTPRLFDLINPELLRFNAFFYGFYYNIKDANYNLWLTVGLKNNISLLYPLFYFSLNSAKFFRKIKLTNWIFLNYLIKDSFTNIKFLEDKDSIGNVNLMHKNLLNYNLQYSDDLINLTNTLGMHSVININSFSGLDYSISANYGFWFYNNLLGVADRLFLQYSFVITANENMQIGSSYLFMKFFYFAKFFRYCFIFFANNILWNNQRYSQFYFVLIKVFKNYLINFIIFNYNSLFFSSNNFHLYFRFHYYLLNKWLFKGNFFIYKGILNIKYINIFKLFNIFKNNIINFSYVIKTFITSLNKHKKIKTKGKIFLNLFSKIYYKFSSNLKSSLIYLGKYLDMIFFPFSKNLCLEDILLYFKFKKIFKEKDRKNYFSLMKDWVFFFFKKYYKYRSNIANIAIFNFSKKLNHTKFNFILSKFCNNKYLFSIYFNRIFISRFYGFFFWNKNYRYRIERKYNSMCHFSSMPWLIEFVWFDVFVYNKISKLANGIFFKFIFFILRKNLFINSSIFCSFFIIINLLLSYFNFCKLYFIKNKSINKNNIIILYNFLFFNHYLSIGKKLFKRKFLDYIIIRSYNKVIK